MTIVSSKVWSSMHSGEDWLVQEASGPPKDPMDTGLVEEGFQVLTVSMGLTCSV